MFRFKALELMNWDCYPNYRIPLDGEIILLVGPNGSGKTTFLDALRVLLNSPRLSKNRTLYHYIQKDVEIGMIKGVVTNQLVNGRRPFAFLGIHGDVDVSLICLIRNKGPQRIEKEFFILKGDISLEDLKSLKSGYSPTQYSKQLEEAGVSRSTLRLIALEQGETDKIGQMKPEELLNLVMDITGNRDIIKCYEDARNNYRKTSQQLIELRSEYNKICEQNHNLERLAQQAQTYKELLDEKRIIELEKLPLAQWYRVLNEIHDIEKNIVEIQEKKLVFDKKVTMLQDQISLMQGNIEGMETQQQELRQTLFLQDKELSQMNQKIGQCHSEWQRMERLKKEIETMPQDLDKESIQTTLEQLQEEYYQKKNKLSQARQDMNRLQQERKDMSQKKIPSFPKEIEIFRDILDTENIDNLIFAEGIEITEPKWQLAIESFLGRERFTIFVDEKDFLYAKKLGEKYKYSNYISKYESYPLPTQIRSNSILANLRVLDSRITARLIGLNEILLVDTVDEGHQYSEFITITVQGYRQDRRGGIFIARDVRFFCGGMAMELQLKENEEQISKQQKVIDTLQQEVQENNTQIQTQEEKLIILRKQEEWEKTKENYDKLQQQGEELLNSSKTLEQEKNKTLEEINKITDERNKKNNEIRDVQKECDKIFRDKRQMEESMADKSQILSQLKWQKEELDKTLPKDTETTYIPEQLEKPEWLNQKLQELNHHIEVYAGSRDLNLIILFEHEKQELHSKRKQLERQEDDQRLRSQELERCRRDYKEMISQTIEFYSKAIKELSDVAGCKMRIQLELGSGESLIEEAKLQVKVAFDKKHEVDIHDKSLSGGQDVISSLILLVALSRIEQERGSGFFIMDEHNAHLDMLRIMEVGHFLRSTKAQFILTTPTTENIAALAVADLIITFSKKEGATSMAPKPRFIRRM